MAFNWQTFKTRTLTAILFAAVMLVGLLWNQWSFFILFSIIHFGCWWEYFNLLEKIHNTSFHKYVRLGFMLVGFAVMLWFCGPAYEINNYRLKENFTFPVSVAGIALMSIGIFQSSRINLKAFGTAALGLLYISLSWGLMVNMRSLVYLDIEPYVSYVRAPHWHHVVQPCLIVFSIWLNDTMAYIVGSLFGKTQLSAVSPKKTWEGTIGGVVLSVFIISFVGSQMEILSVKQAFFISFIATVTGTFGDLFESKLKRMANVKDSGNFMPGHGGFLDRFDSMLFANSSIWLYLLGAYLLTMVFA